MNETNPPSSLDLLRKAVIAQKTAFLPDEAPSPDLETLHRLLLDYDRHVSEMVIAVLQGSTDAGMFPEREAVEAEMARSVESSGERRAVEQYRRYKERLDTMQILALSVASER